jgi:hypothetical protein
VPLTNVQLQVFKLYGLEITNDDLLKHTLFELFGKSSQLPHHEITSRNKWMLHRRNNTSLMKEKQDVILKNKQGF